MERLCWVLRTEKHFNSCCRVGGNDQEEKNGVLATKFDRNTRGNRFPNSEWPVGEIFPQNRERGVQINGCVNGH